MKSCCYLRMRVETTHFRFQFCPKHENIFECKDHGYVITKEQISDLMDILGKKEKEGNRKMKCKFCSRSNMMMHDAELCCDCWWEIEREL